MALVLRLVKGSELTFKEMDDNLIYLESLASGIEEAPIDNKIYVRKDADWEEFPESRTIVVPAKLDLPNDTSYQIGKDGDAINLNVPVPEEYSDVASAFSGIDYNSIDFKSFIGVLKGVNFPGLGFLDSDLIGSFTIVGDPFNPIEEERNGKIIVDGVFKDDEGIVAKRTVTITFSGADIYLLLQIQEDKAILSLVESNDGEIASFIQGNDGEIASFIQGNNGNIQNVIMGDDGNMNNIIIGDDGENLSFIQGNSGNIRRRIEGMYAGIFDTIIGAGSNFSQFVGGESSHFSTIVDGDNSSIWDTLRSKNGVIGSKAEGEYSQINHIVEGENTRIVREVNGSTNSFKETITDSKQTIKVNEIELDSNVEIKGNVKLSNINESDLDFIYGENSSRELVKINPSSLSKIIIQNYSSSSSSSTVEESLYTSNPINPSSWRNFQTYLLNFLISLNTTSEDRSLSNIKVYLSPSNVLDSNSIMIYQNRLDIELWDDSRIGNSVLDISLPIYRGDSNSIRCNGGKIYKYEDTDTHSQLVTYENFDFENDLYLIITCENSNSDSATSLMAVILKEI